MQATGQSARKASRTDNTRAGKDVPAKANTISVFDLAPLLLERLVVHDGRDKLESTSTRTGVSACGILDRCECAAGGFLFSWVWLPLGVAAALAWRWNDEIVRRSLFAVPR